MQSSAVVRRRYPSKTIVVKKNTVLFTTEQGERKSKLSKLHKIQRRKGNLFDNQEINQLSKIQQQKKESESDSESDNSIKKSALSLSSESSVESIKTIKSKSSKRLKSNVKDLTQDLIQHYQTILRKTESQMSHQKQEEIKEKMINHIAFKATAHDYLMKQSLQKQDQFHKNQSQYQSREVSNSDHLSELFSDLSNDDQQSDTSNISLELVNNQSLTPKRENRTDSQSDISPTIPIVEISSTNIKARLTNFQSSIAGFSHLSVTELSQSSNEIENDQLKKLQNQFGKIYQKLSFVGGAAHIKFKKMNGFKKYILLYNSYIDDNPLLYVRKLLVFAYLCIKRISKIIIRSRIYQYILTLVTISNISIFIYQHIAQDKTTLLNINFFFFWCYAIDLILLLLSFGLFRTKFIFLSRIVDILLIILYYYHLVYSNDFFNITPIRMVRFLKLLGAIFEGLQKMIDALIESLKFIFESTAIVILFVLLFASLGTSLFMGLFNERCLPSDDSEWIQCVQGTCPSGLTCVMTNKPYNIPTNFNNIIYSFGLMLKTVTMDDWSFLMYYTIRAFHPIVWIYYVLIIFVGGFFGFNIPIAVFKTHYSEIQQRTIQIFDERQQIISKAQLNKINFYLYIQQINKFLFSHQREIIVNEPRLSKNQQTWDIQPRPLLGSVLNKNKNIDSNFTNFKNQIRTFSIKYILLPKLKQIQKFFSNLDLKRIAPEEKNQFIIRSFNKSSFLLEKYIDFEQTYMPTSQLDVLRSQLFQVFRNTVNQQHRIDKKKKFFYKPIQNKNKLLRNQRTSKSDINAFNSQITDTHKIHLPIKISSRVKKENLNSSDLRVSRSSSDSVSQNMAYTLIKEPNKERRKYPYFIQEFQVPIESEKKPFSQQLDGQLKLLINGVYQDYQNISKRINAMIKQKKQEQIKVQEEYSQIKTKEQTKKIIKIKNWSGNNVLISSISLIQKFDNIFQSLNERDIEIYQISLSGILQNLRKYAFKIIHFNLTKFFFDLTILINTSFLALQGIIDRAIIDRVEDIATVLLSIEIFLQLIVYKPKRIAKNKHHVFELLIIILSLIEFSLSNYLNVSEQYLRLMRSTKCLLFYRCIAYIQMARIIGAIAQLTYKSYIYLTFLMFFTILTFGLIGMELYANKFKEYQQQGYLQSFDDPIKAFMTVFNIMTNDDWFGVYRIGTEITTELSIAYSISLVFTLNYFIYGIMMAIVLDGFSQYLERESSNEENEFMKEKIKQINKLNKQLESDTDQDSQSDSSSNSSSSSIKQYKELANHYTFNNSSKNQLRRESTTPENILLSSGVLKDQLTTKRDNNIGFNEKLFHSLQFPVTRQRRQDPVTDLKKKLKQDLNELKNKTNININKLKGQESKCIKLIQDNIEQMERQILKQNPKIYTGNDCLQSLYIFHKSSNFRKLMYKISSSMIIKYIIDFVLVLSIIYLSLPKEIQEQPYNVTLLFILNTIIFIEFIIKIIAYGLFMDKGAYLNYTWKIVDLIYIIVYYIQFFKIGYLPIFEVIQTFLYFRPLKLLYRIKWVIRVRAALTQSLFDIINVFVVLILVWLMFAVFSIMLYTNKMGFCEEQINYDIGQEECEQQGKSWIVFKHNFDNITTAMPALFAISTFDGWGSILWVSQNSRESFYGPYLYYSQAPTYVFYIAFCTVGAMFFLQLFTGVLFINLKANSKQLENSQLTQVQQEFKKVSEIILYDHPIKATLPKSIIKKFLTSFMTNNYVDYIMFTLLIINCLTIMMIQHNQQQLYNQITNQIHHCCTLIFAFWLLCQLIAFGINRYKDNLWRLYSTFVIILGLIDLIIDIETNWYDKYLHSTQLTQYYQLLRILCMLRNLRIIVIFQGLLNLQRLIRVMSFAFPFLLKILFILLMIMIVFAFYGVMLFGHIDKGLVLDDMINFKNFWLAMLTLFKCVSGDDYRSIMNDCMQHNPYCQEDPKYCGSSYAQIYFILFMLISNNVLLNLFVLSMIEQFELFFNNQDSILQTYVENVDNFRKVWFKYSCKNGQFLNIKQLPYLLLDLQQPLGCSQYDNIWDAAKNTLQYNLIYDYEDNISYNQLLYEIFYNRYQKQIFQQCNDISILKMKNFHKIMTFRLMYYRKGNQFRRNNIGPQLKLKSNNNNPVYFQLIALTVLKLWKNYTQQMISNILIDQQYISERSIRDTEPMKHSITQRSLESLESNNIKLLDKPIYQKRRLNRLKRVSLQGQVNDYLPGDLINPKPILKRKSSFGINVEEGVTQYVYETGRIQRKK